MGNLQTDMDADEGQARVFSFAKPMMRKTTWMLKAAEEGFNVIYFDFEGQYQVANQLSPEARGRIFRIDCSPNVKSFQNCGLFMFLRAMAGETMLYDEVERKFVSASKVEEGKTYVGIDLTKATYGDIVCGDSWTSIVETFTMIAQNSIDPSSVTKIEWDDIAKARHSLDLMVANMKKLRTHFHFSGHVETYAKRKKDAAASDKPEVAVESIRVQPMSISRPHGEVMCKGFTDVLRFTKANEIAGVMITTKGNEDTEGGSRSMPPANYKFDDLNFSNFVPLAHKELAAQNTVFSSNAVKTVKGEDFLAQRAAAKGASKGITVGDKPSILKR